jgi:hypothetical protein
MEAFDRRANLAVFGAAALAWLAVAVVVVSLDPRGDPAVVVIGAAAMGLAVGLTSAPLLWLAAFVRQRRIAYLGDWPRAARRGAWIGGLTALFVFLRAEAILSLPIAAFLMALALVSEAALSGRR